ncbi:class I SAM-dependent methyltransferase [Leptolyngbya sp. GB1-A1]|uniref:class I SAM-dependent methyltransferase n=1 Tax=Leptolyngbya sp. GB1-A1 TaxID=2933908 RepID=UPI003299DECC
MIAEDNDLIRCIDASWSTDSLVVLKGWVLSKTEPIHGMEICIDGVQMPVSWHPRPDVLATYPGYDGADCGFVVEIPKITRHDATFKLATNGSTLLRTLSIEGANPTVAPGFSDASTLFNEFVQKVNAERLRVLEIGSRVVVRGSSSKRSLFPNAASYTGFDYYPDENTDVVGDAHHLSQYFGEQKFDAVFSCFVFEHLAMPWLVAREINKVLKVGGLTFHTTHNAWPIHEEPWDFWRFSDEALKVLFSPALGFQVIKAGYFEPVRMHFAESNPGRGIEGLSMGNAFSGVAILASKAAECEQERFHWRISVEEALGRESQYPRPAEVLPKETAALLTAPVLALEDHQLDPWGNVQSPEPRSQEHQETVQRLRKRIKTLRAKLEASENEIAAMKTSKFWQIRSYWMKLKARFVGNS